MVDFYNPVKPWTGGGRSYGRVNPNPWQQAFVEQYNKAQVKPEAANWNTAVQRGMQLGTRDYTSELRRMLMEDVNRQQELQAGKFREQGMGELAWAKDTQQDWGRERERASTTAATQGQGLQINALEAMRGMLESSSGLELQQMQQALASASAGGGNFNSFMGMYLPYLEKAAMARSANRERYTPSMSGGSQGGLSSGSRGTADPFAPFKNVSRAPGVSSNVAWYGNPAVRLGSR